jgi:predicted nucleic acid-binding protein
VKYVVDTSVAVKWVIPDSGLGLEDGTNLALALLDHELEAPDCMIGEFANALFKKVTRKEINTEQAQAAFAILPSTVSFFPSADLVEPALSLALDMIHPVHDCIFLVSAIQRGFPLVTADRKFYDHCAQTGRPYPILMLDRM